MCQAYWMPDNLPKMMYGKPRDYVFMVKSSEHFSLTGKSFYYDSPKWVKPADKAMTIAMRTNRQYGISVYKNYTGVWNQWYRNGELKSMSILKNSKVNGLHETFFEDGSKQYSGGYINGKIDGKHQGWFVNGGQKFSCFTVKGEMNGEYTRWRSSSGSKESIRYFDKDVLRKLECWNENEAQSFIEYYDNKGNFLKRERFEKGKLIKTEMEQYP